MPHREQVMGRRLLSVTQLGCTGPRPEQSDIVDFPGEPATVQTSSGYTLETPIEIIAADPLGAAVLKKDIPRLLVNRNYELFKSMSLRSIASLSGGELTDQTLTQIKADLAALPNRASSAR